MKIYILLIFSIFFYNGLYGQVLGQDKEGFSSIIQPSASFNLDLTDNVATLNFYQEHFIRRDTAITNLRYKSEEMCRIDSDSLKQYKSMLLDSWKTQELVFKKHGFIYGIDLKGSSSDGITQLVNNEQLITSSTISGLIGLRWHKRSYIEDKELDEYITKSYNYTDESSDEEVKLIADIEKGINELLEEKIIDKDKKDDLLHFRGMKSKEDKIESLNDKISSITNQRGFIDKAREIKSLNDRITILKEMLIRISDIQSYIIKYDVIAAVNTDHKSDDKINVALDSLYKNTNRFNDDLENKLIKPLNLEIDLKELKTTGTWKNAKTKIDDALEFTKYNSYKLKGEPATYSEKTLIEAYETYKSFLEKKKIKFDNLQIAKGNTYTIQRNLVYFKAGFLASSFKYDLANDSTSIGDRFESKNFQGYRLELGYTRQFQRYNFLGLNLAMNRTSNAEELTSTTYKFEKTDTSITPNITTGTEFKALSGSFDTFFKYGVSFDYVRLIPFHDSNASQAEIKASKLLLSVNPYIRHSFYNNSETLQPNTSVGLGLYSFNKENGSIAGGLFVQADDLFNKNREQAVNFTKQIFVGIVFKIAIKSFNPVSE